MFRAPIRLRDSSRSPRARRVPVLLALALAVASGGSLVTATPVGAWDGGAPSTPSETALAMLTNRSRASASLPVLVTDPALVDFARERSRDMAERDYFSHDIPPTGTMVFDTMTAGGYCYVLAGENIGWLGGRDDGAEGRVHELFLESPTHRSVLMAATWDAMGVGTFKRADGRKFWTVLFADRCDDPAGAAMASTATTREAPRSMRVDAGTERGFFESLIGGVTGLFLGS